MNFDDYQKEASRTDQSPYPNATSQKIAENIVPLLGLAGETGELLSEYKKFIRDGEDYRLFREKVEEELGDLLWYITNLASKLDIELEAIAKHNLSKINNRWGGTSQTFWNFDGGFPADERFPRKFEVELKSEIVGGKTRIQPYIDGEKFGDELTDNFPGDDGYRFHDVFHFAYVAILGWSPVVRSLMRRKRKSNATYDEVEDGGRAIVIDEAIVALTFDYASDRNFLKDAESVDFELLRTIKRMTDHLEVRMRTTGEWEVAILRGLDVWRSIVENSGGKMIVDLDNRDFQYVPA